MVNLFGDIRAYVVAFARSWLTLMAGIFSVIAWGLGAYLEPMPLRWTFFACGTAAVIITGFLIWRSERHARLSQAARLKLVRLASNGDRLVADLESSTERQDGILGAVVRLNQWRQECEQTIQAECPPVLEHFTDTGELGPMTTEERARLLIQKIRDVLDVMGRS